MLYYIIIFIVLKWSREKKNTYNNRSGKYRHFIKFFFLFSYMIYIFNEENQNYYRNGKVFFLALQCYLLLLLLLLYIFFLVGVVASILWSDAFLSTM